MGCSGLAGPVSHDSQGHSHCLYKFARGEMSHWKPTANTALPETSDTHSQTDSIFQNKLCKCQELPEQSLTHPGFSSPSDALAILICCDVHQYLGNSLLNTHRSPPQQLLEETGTSVHSHTFYSSNDISKRHIWIRLKTAKSRQAQMLQL